MRSVGDGKVKITCLHEETHRSKVERSSQFVRSASLTRPFNPAAHLSHKLDEGGKVRPECLANNRSATK